MNDDALYAIVFCGEDQLRCLLVDHLIYDF
jgi:hypothetical protein